MENKTAPEITDRTVRKLLKKDFVRNAQNNAEWLLIQYNKNVTEQERNLLESECHKILKWKKTPPKRITSVDLIFLSILL